MLAIKAISFELGQPLSEQARNALQETESFLLKLLQQKDFKLWDQPHK